MFGRIARSKDRTACESKEMLVSALMRRVQRTHRQEHTITLRTRKEREYCLERVVVVCHHSYHCLVPASCDHEELKMTKKMS